MITIDDVTVSWFMDLYGLCRDILARPADYADACRGQVMGSLFFEPSTRTSFSFQAAMMRLGGSVFGFSDQATTSASKGETLADTIRMCAGYADALVMRSPLEGAAKAAALYSQVPVINAGDGGHMHPTQTLTDLTTIFEKRGDVKGLNIGLCGDLKYGRTVHSLALMLSKFPGVQFTLISPRDLAMPDYLLAWLRERGQRYIEVTNMEASMPRLDVLYMTRIQRERFTDPLEYARLKGVYTLTRSKLDRAKKELLIMHPLPRVDEISSDVDEDPRAVYFQQARYGMFIRMALLLQMCRMPRMAPPAAAPPGERLCGSDACVTAREGYLPPLVRQAGNARYCGYCDKQLRT